jgi:RND family efflux transporter MFP subunit
MMRGKGATALITATLAIVGTGCGHSSVASDPDHASNRTPNPSPASSASQQAVSQTPAKSSDVGDILSVLSVEHQVDVSTQRDGVIVSIARDEGSAVKAGDIMGQLDDRSLQMELVKARNDLQVSQNNVKYKEAELKAKTAAHRRQQQLREMGLSSDADLEATEFQAKGAEYDLHGWEALVESGQAEIQRFEIEIDQTRLRAPFSGVVVRRYIREGQGVAKEDKCFRVSQLAPLQVLFQVPESSGRRPERGAPVDLFLIADSQRLLNARVIKVSPTIDPAGDSYNVTAQLTGSGQSDLRPGMAVRVGWPGTVHPKP